MKKPKNATTKSEDKKQVQEGFWMLYNIWKKNKSKKDIDK